MWSVIHADALEALKTIEDNQFDSVVTDPPYGLSNTDPEKVVRALTHWLTDDRAYVPSGKGFMGKKWDEFVPPPAVWDEVYRVLKPGGHALVFAGTRTHGLMEISIRLAGFDIRDSIDWIYGSGFPKSRDISKAIDSEAGAEREVIGDNPRVKQQTGQKGTDALKGDRNQNLYLTAPATEDAKQWEGWGTALKPAHEPIIVARKPLAAKTVAANVLEYGTGGINVDACRVSGTKPVMVRTSTVVAASSMAGESTGATSTGETTDEGRWSPNILLSDEAAEEMDRQSGRIRPTRIEKPAEAISDHHRDCYSGGSMASARPARGYKDDGGASRFFPVFKYNAKASKKERPVVEGIPGHPTVKPIAVMRWLVKLVTPPDGIVLDPFTGTGTTGEACELEGFNSILIENDPDSIRRIDKRMEKYETPEVA